MPDPWQATRNSITKVRTKIRPLRRNLKEAFKKLERKTLDRSAATSRSLWLPPSPLPPTGASEPRRHGRAAAAPSLACPAAEALRTGAESLVRVVRRPHRYKMKFDLGPRISAAPTKESLATAIRSGPLLSFASSLCVCGCARACSAEQPQHSARTASDAGDLVRSDHFTCRQIKNEEETVLNFLRALHARKKLSAK